MRLLLYTFCTLLSVFIACSNNRSLFVSVSEALLVHNYPGNFAGEALDLSEDHLQIRLFVKRTSVTTSVCAESF